MLIKGVLNVEIRFSNNSTEEDGHEVERSVDGGAYAALVTLAPHRYFYYDTGVSGGHSYAYKIRAYEGAVYTSYSTAGVVTIASAPSAPTGLTIGTIRYPDRISLTWTESVGAVGYYVLQSTDGSTYSTIATLPEGFDRYTVSGLISGTLYYFKVQAIGVGGASAASSAVNGTTATEYIPTALEKLCRTAQRKLINLVEVNPAIVLSGWTLTAGTTYIYETDLFWNEITIDGVTANGIAFPLQASLVDLGSSNGYFVDYTTAKIYVHILAGTGGLYDSFLYDDGTLYDTVSGGGDPTTYVIVASAWAYFTNWQKGSTVFNGHRYLPLIPADGLPSVTQTLDKYWQGSLVATTGSVSFINGWGKAWGGHFFDTRCAAWEWKNRTVRILAGGVDFAYVDFLPLVTGVITATDTGDTRFTVSLGDARSGLRRSLPLRTYSLNDFPNLQPGVDNGEGSGGNPRPYYYGAATHVDPTCLDTVNLIWELMDGRMTSVESAVMTNAEGDTTLAAGTDYWLDYSLGRIQLSSALGFDTEADKLLLSFTGAPDGLGNAINTGPMICLHFLRTFLELDLDAINLESIFEAALVSTVTLAMKIYKTMTSEDFLGLLEKSCLAYSFQDTYGRVGFRITPTVAPPDVIYLQEERIFDFQRSDSVDQVYAQVQVDYDEWPSTKVFRTVTAQDPTAKYKTGIFKTLPITAAQTTETDAQTLADNVLNMIYTPEYSLKTSRILFPRPVGDVVYVTRKRWFDSQPAARLRLCQIMQIGKMAGTGQVSIKIQPVN
jgi:hypothetical protein